AAYSMGRALYAAYHGPLYQVQRASDGATADIGLLSPGGYVEASEQDSFCAGTTCTIVRIYDQSPEGNDLTVEGAGGAAGADGPASATALPVTVHGHKAYGLDITPGTGYRDDSTQGIAVNGQPEGMYMVASGTNVNGSCCFDFGNAETSNDDNGAGHMDTLNLSLGCTAPCTGTGPWVEADMENGVYMGGDGSNPANTADNADFVTAMLKNDGQTTFELQGGNAQAGRLMTYWNGNLPSGYEPMHQEGAVVLGTGGDNSNSDTGSFFEGVMTQGYPSNAADAAIQASVVAAHYAGYSGGSGPAPTAGPAVVHDGYSSMYTVDASNGHLQETCLPAIGDPWTTQDLSAKYGTPPSR
ncbi:MAG TPA: arabinofuranosidase catalytic domain-containing protein, partial [Streptosporangiaceae bacterium]